jgi:hypothetical protein
MHIINNKFWNINIHKWSPIPKRKDRRLKFTRPPVLLVDHCENLKSIQKLLNNYFFFKNMALVDYIGIFFLHFPILLTDD